MTSIYICDLSNLNENFIAENLKKIPAFRQEYCNLYKLDFDKAAKIAAYLLLKKGLKEQYGIDSAISFIYNKNGKPYLKEYPDIFFNFSHCKNYVVCALNDSELGVDIQDIRPYDEDVAKRVCSETEMTELSKSDSPEELFFKIWTKKESYVKARGIKLFDVLKKDLPDDIFFSYTEDNFCLTLCRLGTIDNQSVAVYRINL